MNTLLSINPEILEDIIVPLGICVVLPCLIVFLVMWARRNEMNRKTEVALKAIESGAQIDPNFFATPKSKKDKTIKAKVFGYLTTGLILSGLGLATAIISVIQSVDESNLLIPGAVDLLIPGAVLLFLGVAFLAIYFIARKQFAAEIRAEEEKLGKTE